MDNAAMKRRLHRLWPVWSAVLAVILLGSFIAWRSSQAEFGFLSGHKPKRIWKGSKILLGIYYVTGADDLYAFRADPNAVIAMADRLLLGAGWRKVVKSWPQAERPSDFVYYVEPRGQDRFVLINPNSTFPTPSAAANYVVYTPEYRAGWVCVTVLHPGTKLAWWDRTRPWLEKIFLGRP